MAGTIEGLTARLSDIYGASNYWHLAAEAHCHEIFRRAAGLLEAGRKIGNEGTEQFSRILTDIFAWTLTLISGLGLDCSRLLAQKYPGCCPNCLSKPCQCGETKPAISNLPFFDATEFTVAEWQELFAEIYPNNTLKPPEDHLIKLVEEIGEIVTAQKQDEQQTFQKEMADVLARMYALANYFSISLEGEIARRYHCHCPKCKTNPCSCSKNDIVTNYRPKPLI